MVVKSAAASLPQNRFGYGLHGRRVHMRLGYPLGAGSPHGQRIAHFVQCLDGLSGLDRPQQGGGYVQPRIIWVRVLDHRRRRAAHGPRRFGQPAGQHIAEALAQGDHLDQVLDELDAAQLGHGHADQPLDGDSASVASDQPAQHLFRKPGVQPVFVAEHGGMERSLVLLAVVLPGKRLIEQARLAGELAGRSVVSRVVDAEALGRAAKAGVPLHLRAAEREVRSPGGEGAAVEAAKVVGELLEPLGLGDGGLPPGALHHDRLQVLGPHDASQSGRAAGVVVSQNAGGGDHVLARGTNGDHLDVTSQFGLDGLPRPGRSLPPERGGISELDGVVAHHHVDRLVRLAANHQSIVAGELELQLPTARPGYRS